MNRSDKAAEYFRDKFNCSQSVFAVFGQDYGISEDDCLRIGCAFGAGMGRQQLTCGAVTGALMALGLKHGKASGDPEEKKLETYRLAREFVSQFKAIHGSTICKELLCGLDMNNAGDYQKIIDRKLFSEKCVLYIRDAVKTVERLS